MLGRLYGLHKYHDKRLEDLDKHLLEDLAEDLRQDLARRNIVFLIFRFVFSNKLLFLSPVSPRLLYDGRGRSIDAIALPNR